MRMRMSIVIITIIFQNKYHLDIFFTFSLSHHSGNNRIYYLFFSFIIIILFASSLISCVTICELIFGRIFQAMCAHTVSIPRESTERWRQTIGRQPHESLECTNNKRLGFASECSTWRCSSCTQSFQISNFAALFHWIQSVHFCVLSCSMCVASRVMPLCFAFLWLASLEIFILRDTWTFYFSAFSVFSLFFFRYCNEKENKKYFSHLSFISDISNFRRFCFIVTRRLDCFC